MTLIRLIAIAVVLWLAWTILRRWLARARRPAARTRGTPKQVEQMVRCAHCGLHVPEKEAVAAGGRHYCSARHRDAGAA